MTRLTSLILRGNPLRQPFGRLADAHGDLAAARLLDPYSERIDMSECGFDRLPAEVGRVALVLRSSDIGLLLCSG
jgi:hypothetical protein